MNDFTEWQSFYVFLGSAAGALIGLQFVLMALLADSPASPNGSDATGAIATPTVVHFGASLVVSGVLLAPWHGVGVPSAICGAVGLAGVAYAVTIALRMKRQTAYRPVGSDWFFYVVIPLAAYLVLAAAGFASERGARAATFAIGGAALLLVAIGIRNAWDSVTYHVLLQREERAVSRGKKAKDRRSEA